ncbi:uncharacterized protein LOC111264149 [Varroa jacobsoni]|uniref:Uncharacterized protein n=1 Tax=Varroa destructor TaxID=109461 RepID=A0A7M7JK09_VARDE|nr:uncharacterized protein LOC111246851 [Varroa destructor]XP_022652867.1 uncharacterized protein LOC111246851 [Varroa destructor]XP_022695528.1 uncharacterized protein LOC111264149 [Varroa jacobsoni]XP_022695529.1 uncharacterized protein LOC111264149 [Varroa jacobsoni]
MGDSHEEAALSVEEAIPMGSGEEFIPYIKFATYAPTPENLKIFQRYRPPRPENPTLGFALKLPPLGKPAQPFIGGWLGASMCLGGSYAGCSPDVYLDVLRIACLCGKPDVVETLLAHRTHTVEREIESLELLGAVRMFCVSTMDWFCNEPWTTALCWSKAMELRASLPEPQSKLSWRSRLMRLRDVRPVSTLSELNEICDSPSQLLIQAFLVLERILGLPWTVTEPQEGLDFIAARLLEPMVKGICHQASSTAQALELLGYLIVYVPNKVAHTCLLKAINNMLAPTSAVPNWLTLMQDCQDVTLRDATDFLRFFFSRHPTRQGYDSAFCLRLVCCKLDAGMLSEDKIAKNMITKDDLNILFHALAIVWAMYQPERDPQLEALATKLLELGAAVNDPCWFRMKCAFQIVCGVLQQIVMRYYPY